MVSFSVRVAMLVGIALALSVYIIIIQRLRLLPYRKQKQFVAPSSLKPTPKSSSRIGSGYDCSIYWLRMPKTASTSIYHTFIGPMLGLFRNTENGPNTCFEGVGGCATFWKGTSYERISIRQQHQNNSTTPFRPPPYGNISVPAQHATSNNQRCFPREGGPKIYCYEYDVQTSVLNFGPHRHIPKTKRKKKPPTVSTWKTIQHYASSGPNLKTHVGLDPSLFGWVLPKKPMVFSTFRDPVDRLLSSFHYGIKFGGGRPGEVGKCNLLGVDSLDEWQERVVDARKVATLKNDTSDYQKLLRDYLDVCRDAADNAYVQFLDPYSKNVNVALANLERYVIVGLQSDMDLTLDRWKNITLQSCHEHPRFQAMKKVLNKMLESQHKDNAFFRKSVTRVVAADSNDDEVDIDRKHRHLESADVVDLVSPDIKSFDEDLQQLVREMTAGDEVIYKRVIEMHESLRMQH